MGPGIRQEEGLRHRRGPDLRDGDPSPSPRNRVSPGDGATYRPPIASWVRSARSLTAGSTGWRRMFLPRGTSTANDQEGLAKRADDLLEQRLVEITRATPQFAAALRSYRTAQRQNDHAHRRGIGGLACRSATRRRLDQEGRRDQGGRGPLRRPELPAGIASDPQGLGLLRARARPRRDRDAPEGSW